MQYSCLQISPRYLTPYKEKINTSRIWSPQRNCYGLNDALQKQKAIVRSTDSDTNFFWYCRWNLARSYISTISIHNLSRSRSTNVNRSNERKWPHTKNGRRYAAGTIKDADDVDDLAHLTNTPANRISDTYPGNRQ